MADQLFYGGNKLSVVFPNPRLTTTGSTYTVDDTTYVCVHEGSGLRLHAFWEPVE